MTISHEVETMCKVAKGPHHGPAPIPEEGKWVKAYEIKDISGFTHGVGWCAPQQGACKLTLNVKEGVVQEALVETLGCSGMTHSAAMAAEILPGKTILEALNTDLVCDAINVAMRELFCRSFTAEASPLSLKMDLPSAPRWKTWAKVFVRRLAPCSAPRKRASAIWKWQKAMSQKWRWMKTMRLSVISSSSWAKCLRTSVTALLPRKL